VEGGIGEGGGEGRTEVRGVEGRNDTTADTVSPLKKLTILFKGGKKRTKYALMIHLSRGTNPITTKGKNKTN